MSCPLPSYFYPVTLHFAIFPTIVHAFCPQILTGGHHPKFCIFLLWRFTLRELSALAFYQKKTFFWPVDLQIPNPRPKLTKQL